MDKKYLKREIIVTKDGSQTLIIPELNEQYHSLNGAVQESEHVFIHAGLSRLKHLNRINIFEVGFGTGLNALLSYYHSSANNIFYHSIEKYPLIEKEYSVLKFADFISDNSKFREAFNQMHKCQWGTNVEINEHFTLQKDKMGLDEFLTNQKFDLIYFDAFAPDIQPDLWTTEVFSKMYNILGKNGILVTYCAKGQVRRNMMEVGFSVERIPGPPGKRQMMRATKP